jgi:hypothetical protein
MPSKSSDSIGAASVGLIQAGRVSSQAVSLSKAGMVVQAALLDPVVGGAVVGLTGAGLYGIGNLVSYARKTKTPRQALGDTVKGAGGLGVSAGLGIWAGNAAAGSGFVLGSSVVLPLIAGVTVTFIAKRIWNKAVYKKIRPNAQNRITKFNHGTPGAGQ